MGDTKGGAFDIEGTLGACLARRTAQRERPAE